MFASCHRAAPRAALFCRYSLARVLYSYFHSRTVSSAMAFGSKESTVAPMLAFGPSDEQAQVTAKSAGGGDARSLHDVEPDTTARFLRRVHEGACGIFGTVLGPEANEAHRNHLHLDLAARKRSALCE
jgi:hypothetical protein